MDELDLVFIPTVNPLLSPPGAYFFLALLKRGEAGGLKERGAYLIKQNASPVAKIP